MSLTKPTWRVRFLYTSAGGETLACEANGLARSAAQTLLWHIQGCGHDAVMFTGGAESLPKKFTEPRLVILPSQQDIAPERIEVAA